MTSTTIGSSEASSEVGSFTINSILRSHGNKCGCHQGQGSTGTGSGFSSTKKSSRRNAFVEPIYENLDFHRVKISIPGAGGRAYLLNDASGPAGSSSGGRSMTGPGNKVQSVNTRIVRRQRVNRNRPVRGATVDRPVIYSRPPVNLKDMSEKERKRFFTRN